MGIYERMSVMAFRPQVEVIDLTGKNLEIEEFDRLDGAANLLVERLQRLEVDRESLDPVIFEKLRREYDQKLKEAERRLKAKRKALSRRLREMEDARAVVEIQRTDLEREIKELEVRRRIGEYPDAVFEHGKAEKLSDLEFLGRKLEVLRGNIDHYRRALAKEKDAFPCSACGAMNLIWEKRCRECGADVEGLAEGGAAPAPAEGPAGLLPIRSAPAASAGAPGVAPGLERTLIRDLASLGDAPEGADDEPVPDGERPCLVRIQGPNSGQRIRIQSSELCIGKAPDNHLSIPDDRALSRRHAKIVFDGGRVTLYDLGSTNGTAVNGRAVEVSELEDKDEIALGSSIYRFCA